MENAARAIIKIDNDYIFMKRTNKPNSKYKVFYAFPGGRLEPDETFEQACIREIYEELGINIKINTLFFENDNEIVNKHEKYYIATYVSGNIGTGEGEEFATCDELSYGKYEVVRINEQKINDYNILPEEVKLKLIEYINLSKTI